MRNCCQLLVGRAREKGRRGEIRAILVLWSEAKVLICGLGIAWGVFEIYMSERI